MPQNFYELIWIFVVYAFLGWCTEVSYAALDTGTFVNRGFLNGPYCPIYGFGVVIVVSILTPLKENLLILFLGSVILTTALEFLTGFLLEKVFHNKWWDYTDKPFNIKGYICLKFSVYWGLACTFIMDILHPIIYDTILWIPHTVGMILISVFMMIFLVDGLITISTILKLNRHLKIMDEMAAAIHRLSDEIGENIYENISDVIEKSETFHENHAGLSDRLSETRMAILQLPENAKNKLTETTDAARERYVEKIEQKKHEYVELIAKYQKLSETKHYGFRRLVEAFPDMISRDNNETLQKLKDRFRIERKRKKEIGTNKEKMEDSREKY